MKSLQTKQLTASTKANQNHYKLFEKIDDRVQLINKKLFCYIIFQILQRFFNKN